MYRVTKHDDIDTVTITQQCYRNYVWLAGQAYDNRTDKLENVEIWFEVGDISEYRAEASRIFAELGYTFNEVIDYRMVSTLVDSFDQYAKGARALNK